VLAWTVGFVVLLGWRLGVVESTLIAVLVGIPPRAYDPHEKFQGPNNYSLCLFTV
jgi:hypothetical protein